MLDPERALNAWPARSILARLTKSQLRIVAAAALKRRTERRHSYVRPVDRYGSAARRVHVPRLGRSNRIAAIRDPRKAVAS